MSFEVNSALEILYLSILTYLITVFISSIVALVIKRPISRTTLSFFTVLGIFSLFIIQLSNLEVFVVQVSTLLIVAAIHVALSLSFIRSNVSNEHAQLLNDVLERFSLAGLRLKTTFVRISLVLLLLSPVTYLILGLTLLEVGLVA
jgi:hypothetical protein